MDDERIRLEVAAIMNGYFNDIQNGMDFSFTANDMCYSAVYNFGVFASLYALNKNLKLLQKFLSKYSYLNNKDKFVYPTKIDASKIEDATILSNAFLELCKVITSKNIEEAIKKAPKGIFDDMLDLFEEIYPRYSKNSSIDLKQEYFNLMSKKDISDMFEKRHSISTITEEEVLRSFVLTNYELVMGKYKDPIFLACTFSLPVNNANMVQYLSYVPPIYKFGENPSNYMGGILSNTRKCKTFASFLNEADEYKVSEIEKKEAEIKRSVSLESKKNNLLEQVNDGFTYEVTTLLLMNGFNFYEEISKADIINALQVRCATNKYNGEWDSNNYNKMFADVVISVLSRKLKDATIGKHNVDVKETRVYVDENKEVKALEEKNTFLENQNKVLQEKVESFKRKESKENSRMDSLEKKVKELEKLLKEKELEVEALEELLDTVEGEMNDIETLSKETDYHSLLSTITENNKVVLVGGNYNLVSKLKGVLPNITYISDSEKTRITDELIKNASIVLFKTDCLGHSSFESVTSKCDRFDIPYGYLKPLTNTKALERNMYEVINEKL